jgi:hypothetical protein
MTQPIFFDEIAQIFLSNGNFHIILGVSTGEIHPDGEDMKSEVASLIIPENKLIKLIPELELAVSQLTKNKAVPKQIKNTEKSSSNSYEGKPLIFKK